MVAGSPTDGGNQVTSFRVRKIIQSIKEIVGNHSDEDIYVVLKESNMDPNETAQKLLNQDPFHEVKRKRDKKKELTGYRALSDTRRHVEHNVQPAKSQTWDRNVRRGGYIQNSVPDAGVSREFRIVRDNRVKQTANRDVKPEPVQHSASGKDQAKSDFPGKSAAGTLDQKPSAFSSSEGSLLPQCVNMTYDSALDGPCGGKEEVDLGGTLGPSMSEKASATATVTSSQAQRAVKDNSKTHSTSTSANSVIGVYYSSTDPVHVPSTASRLAGTVSAIRREVGVVGVRKQPSSHPASSSSVPNSSSSVPLLDKDVSALSQSFGQTVGTSKSSQLNQPTASEPTVPSMATSRPSSASQYNTKHQQPVGHQKAMQSTMEWKPKSSQKPAVISPSMSGTASAPNSSRTDNSSSSNAVDVTNLTEKLSNVNIWEERHVIIPRHLRVPESERTQLTFGSFGAGFDSTKVSSSVSQAIESAEESSDEPSISISASVPVGSSGNASGDDHGDLSDGQATTRSDSSASASESEQATPGNNEPLNHQNIENYADIGLVQSHSPAYTSSHTHQLQAPTSLPSFSEYDSQKSYDDLPFLRTVMEDNTHAQVLASSSEAVSSHATNSSTPSTGALAQQQQPLQQQPLTNMYHQVHISHFPNFMPYRHIFSPVYVPPMAMPNYSSNPAYPHHSNGSSYLLMPGGNSHVTAGGMKYAASHSQYKPVPAGSPTTYGNYTNPTGFTINPPGTVGGATGLEDATRIKYKDNNLYVPNPQAEASDIWIQTPRELPSLQSAPYYNLAGQPFVPAAHAGHASFNAAAAQSSHVPYPGLYHPPASPAPIAGPHHLVHQSGLGGVGVAPAAPGPQVGAYQQPQLSHMNWPANF